MKKKEKMRSTEIYLHDAITNVGNAKGRFASIVELCETDVDPDALVDAVKGVALGGTSFCEDAEGSLAEALKRDFHGSLEAETGRRANS